MILKNTRLQAALRYAELGYRVFPCRPDSKIPATAHGSKEATTDADQIERWWIEEPLRNVAIATDGLCVLDVDHAGQAWAATIDPVELLRAPMCCTPHNGKHYWHRQNGVALSNTAGKIAPGIDTRANGGYVLVPPSTIDDKPYVWVTELDSDLPIVPAWLVEATEQRKRLSEENSLEIISQGRRNVALTRMAGLIRSGGLSAEAISAALREVNRCQCRPPLPEKEVDGIARSVARYEPSEAQMAVIHNMPSAEQLEATGEQPNEKTFGRLTSEQLFGTTRTFDYLIDGFLVAGQHALISAPFKCQKSHLSDAITLALATGLPLFGQFAVARPRRVAVYCGEGGEVYLERRVRAVAASMGITEPQQLANITWHTAVPRITDASHRLSLIKLIQLDQPDLVVLDPSYLMLGQAGEQAGNLFVMGTALDHIKEIEAVTNTTFLVNAHNNRRAEDYAIPTLRDVGWAGLAEWAGQWILLNHRCPFNSGGRESKLWLVVGGRAGHGGLWGLNIDEFSLGDPAWKATLVSETEARETKGAAGGKRAKRSERASEMASRILDALQADKRHAMTNRSLSEVCHTNAANDVFMDAVKHLVADGRVRTGNVEVERTKQQYPGLILLGTCDK